MTKTKNQTCTSKPEGTVTTQQQNSGLVIFYNFQPGKRKGLFFNKPWVHSRFQTPAVMPITTAHLARETTPNKTQTTSISLPMTMHTVSIIIVSRCPA